MDNSAFERFQEKLPVYTSKQLLKLGRQIGADYIVMPDFPYEDYQKTIEAAVEFKQERFQFDLCTNYNPQTIFVPQSKAGDLEGFVKCFRWGVENLPGAKKSYSYKASKSSDIVNRIALSILGVPNAFGVLGDSRQQFVSRFSILSLLEKQKLLTYTPYSETLSVPIHCLGLFDGPGEIELLSRWKNNIVSWDSSSAIWHGIQHVVFDDTPTNLNLGKSEVHVDFFVERPNNVMTEGYITTNMIILDKICYDSMGWKVDGQ